MYISDITLNICISGIGLNSLYTNIYKRSIRSYLIPDMLKAAQLKNNLDVTIHEHQDSHTARRTSDTCWIFEYGHTHELHEGGLGLWIFDGVI